MGLRIGVDIGGTFTDFIVADDDGAVQVYKTPSTPDAPEQAIFGGIAELAQQRDLSVEGFLSAIDLFIHGTTIATNAVLVRRGPKLGVLHTEGFRDILFLRDGHKDDRYNLHVPPPDPFVERDLRLGVVERILYTGEVETPLDEASVRAALRTMAAAGVESVAVCLMWSIVNPQHERRVGELVAEELPDAYVALSADILPALREYPRTCAAALSAYVGPVLGRYLSTVSSHLSDHGYRYDLLIMQVTGGSARVSDIEKRPVLAIDSGPAAGPSAGVVVGAEEQDRNLIVMDMGGTSFDVSVVTGGAFTMSRERKIDGMPIGVAAVDIHSVGAGGGSIAWIDSGGMLRVGPQSAGAEPGPACYGAGGEQPTVTDANVILGYLDPAYFLGGRLALDRDLALRAMQRVAEPLGVDVVEAAAAVYRIVNTNMVAAVRAVSIMRGIDPRGYTAVVGGGAGGTHAAKIAEELGMANVICPTVAGGLCAFGMLAADVRQSYLTTYPMNTGQMDVGRVNELFDEMEARARAELRSQGFADGEIEITRAMDAKYPYQLHEILVVIPGGALTEASVADLATAFHDEHERLYTYCLRDMDVDMNGWRVTAIGRLPDLPRARLPEATPAADAAVAQKGSRETYFEELREHRETPIYDGAMLTPGLLVDGPGIVELPTTTLVVMPGHTLRVNGRGDFRITIPAAADGGPVPMAAGVAQLGE
jgi:N-methylhydantoinase A